ncbi:MAG: hypothetical protein KDJ68_14605 [Rhodobiaceae bacterium]|nr:hypothetical protein [Rhodobiaceae bacterium]
MPGAIRCILMSALAVGVFTALSLAIYYLFLGAFGGGRLFYDGLIAIAASAAILLAAVIAATARGRTPFGGAYSRQELVTAVLAASFLVYAFHITLPTIVDRSISLFILSRVDREAGLSIEEMQSAFVDGYVSGHDAVCRRVDEQLGSGNIVFRDGRYVLTPTGAMLLSGLRAMAGALGQSTYFITSRKGTLPYRYSVRDGQCALLGERSG